MLKLYFSSFPSILSTVLIVGFGVFFSLVSARRGSINHWGVLVICVFFLGFLMSLMSGFKDGVNTSSALIPPKSLMMTVLTILGALAFVVGIAALIIRKQNIWQIEFYLLSAIILIKTVLVEVYRIFAFIRG
jgi:hypothetical protein